MIDHLVLQTSNKKKQIIQSVEKNEAINTENQINQRQIQSLEEQNRQNSNQKEIQNKGCKFLQSIKQLSSQLEGIIVIQEQKSFIFNQALQKPRKVRVLYLPGELKIEIKSIDSIDLQNLSIKANFDIKLKVFCGKLQEQIIKVVKKKMMLLFQKQQALQLNQFENGYINRSVAIRVNVINNQVDVNGNAKQINASVKQVNGSAEQRNRDIKQANSMMHLSEMKEIEFMVSKKVNLRVQMNWMDFFFYPLTLIDTILQIQIKPISYIKGSEYQQQQNEDSINLSNDDSNRSQRDQFEFDRSYEQNQNQQVEHLLVNEERGERLVSNIKRQPNCYENNNINTNSCQLSEEKEKRQIKINLINIRAEGNANVNATSSVNIIENGNYDVNESTVGNINGNIRNSINRNINARNSFNSNINIHRNVQQKNQNNNQSSNYNLIQCNRHVQYGEYQLAQQHIRFYYSDVKLYSIEQIRKSANKEIENENGTYRSSSSSNDLGSQSSPLPHLPHLPQSYSFAYYYFPLFHRPINFITQIFLPLFLLALINQSIFFQGNNLGQRIASITAVMIAFIALIPTIRDKIPPYPIPTLIQALVYLETMTSIVVLFHSCKIMDDDEWISVQYSMVLKDYYFIVALIISAIVFFVPVIYLAISSIKMIVRWKFRERQKLRKLENNLKRKQQLLRQKNRSNHHSHDSHKTTTDKNLHHQNQSDHNSSSASNQQLRNNNNQMINQNKVQNIKMHTNDVNDVNDVNDAHNDITLINSKQWYLHTPQKFKKYLNNYYNRYDQIIGQRRVQSQCYNKSINVIEKGKNKKLGQINEQQKRQQIKKQQKMKNETIESYEVFQIQKME